MRAAHAQIQHRQMKHVEHGQTEGEHQEQHDEYHGAVLE